MKITIKDYSGHNPKCETVQSVLKFIEKKGTCTIEQVFKKAEIHFSQATTFYLYLIDSRKEEYKQWALKHFSFEYQMQLNEKELYKLQEKKNLAQQEVTKIEGLNPARVYSYFLSQQKYITDRNYDIVLNDVLKCIMASSIFEDKDYELLYKSLRTRIQWHCNIEWHYRIAIENNNNTAWKSIELFLNRKPYLVDGKRCYDCFEFQLARNEYYRCTGWNEKGNIKFVLYSEPNGNGKRKQLNFTREQFNEYFKGKKMFQW